jgi:VWFA-related protein
MARHALAALLALGSLVAALEARPGELRLAPQEQPFAFKSSIELVPIHASVRDGRGRPLRGLQPADFEVLDGGIRRPIVTFEADDRAPIHVAFLIDVSGSMSVAGKLALARETLARILEKLHANLDQVAVFTFDSALHERQTFTRDLDRVSQSFPDVEPFGNTSLYDAVAATARRVQAQAEGRVAIVVFTDGVDTSSRLTAAEVSGLASSIDLPIYVIAAVAQADRSILAGVPTAPKDGYAADLRDLADWTGGKLMVVSSNLDAGSQASTLVTELRHQYILGIDAAETSGWRSLDVRVRVKAAVVRARTGYFARPTG